MRYQRFKNRLQIRLEVGDHAQEAVLAVARAEHIGYATLTGLGAARWVRLAYWNAERRQYDEHEFEEQLEVASLIGNVTVRDGAPFVHWHISVARQDLSVLGGHLLDVVAHPTMEIWLQAEDATVTRSLDAYSGLALMDLPEHL